MRIVIDGNIGSGKSTVIQNISDLFKMLRVIQENVSDWNPFLKNFYSDMKKNSLQFQMKVLEHHLISGNLTKNDKFSIHERSLISCINVFGKDLYNSDFLSDLDMELMNSYCKNLGWYPDVIIYLKADAEISYQRCKKRNRDGEEEIPFDYLNNINNLYNDLYPNIDGHKHFVKTFDNGSTSDIYIIDANKSSIDVLNETYEIINNLINNN